MTHRQFLTWQAWLAMQWNRPSRSDHYIMQLTAETIRPHLKQGAKVKPGDYRLKFETAADQKRQTPPQSLEDNKAIWAQATAGMRGVRYTPAPTVAEPNGQGE